MYTNLIWMALFHCPPQWLDISASEIRLRHSLNGYGIVNLFFVTAEKFNFNRSFNNRRPASSINFRYYEGNHIFIFISVNTVHGEHFHTRSDVANWVQCIAYHRIFLNIELLLNWVPHKSCKIRMKFSFNWFHENVCPQPHTACNGRS